MLLYIWYRFIHIEQKYFHCYKWAFAVCFGPVTRTAKVRRYWDALNNFLEALLLLSNPTISRECQCSLHANPHHSIKSFLPPSSNLVFSTCTKAKLPWWESQVWRGRGWKLLKPDNILAPRWCDRSLRGAYQKRRSCRRDWDTFCPHTATKLRYNQ